MKITSEEITQTIEEASHFLRALYRNRSQELTNRLSNFERINWPGLKANLVEHIQVHLKTDKPSLQNREAVRQEIIHWLENTLTD